MNFLRQIVHKAILRRDYAATFGFLVSKLTESNIAVEKEDRDRGEIVVRCLTLPVNLVFWRCWSDKLIVEIKSVDVSNTQITIYAVPNLLRIKVNKGERVVELDTLVSKLVM